MPQDAFTLRYLCIELDQVFKSGKVNKIIQPNNDELIITVYTGKRTEKLLLNVNPSSPRIGITSEEKESPLAAPNFCMLMRKHLLSATVQGVQLIGFDRIVKISFLSSNEFTDSVIKDVYVELMGRYSNVILTENGKILGGNRGINMFDNGVRPLIVGQSYVFPPVGDKKLPSEIETLNYFKNFNGENLEEYICKGVQGIALSTATEIVRSYVGEYDGQKFYNHLNDFLFDSIKRPCVITENGTVKDVCVFPYQSVCGSVMHFNNLCSAEDYYFYQKETLKRYLRKKERLNSIISTAVKKVKKRLTAINAKIKDASNAEDNKIKGELILANVYRIEKGSKKVVLENYYDNNLMEVCLDDRLSPAKNAESYYKKYNKQKRTLLALEPQKKQAETELDYLTSVLDEISLAEDYNELSLIENELLSTGLITNKNQVVKRRKENESFCRVYDIQGFAVRAGRNNTENDKLTFNSKPEDVWIHAKDYHSSHVVIEAKGKTVPYSVIILSCEICAYYSKGREGGKTEVVYTERKNVKKPSRSNPGFCTYDNYKSVIVEPEKHVELIKSNNRV